MTTKEQEKAILGKIEALINETEPGSYIRMAFCGCVRLAQENIEYDFGNSYPEMIEYKDAEIQKRDSVIAEYRDGAEIMRKNILCLEKEISQQDAKIRELQDQLNASAKAYSESRRDMDGIEHMLADKDAEIIRLKAKLYDLLVK